jgi:hypothetical protein
MHCITLLVGNHQGNYCIKDKKGGESDNIKRDFREIKV